MSLPRVVRGWYEQRLVRVCILPPCIRSGTLPATFRFEWDKPLFVISVLLLIVDWMEVLVQLFGTTCCSTSLAFCLLGVFPDGRRVVRSSSSSCSLHFFLLVSPSFGILMQSDFVSILPAVPSLSRPHFTYCLFKISICLQCHNLAITINPNPGPSSRKGTTLLTSNEICCSISSTNTSIDLRMSTRVPFQRVLVLWVQVTRGV